MIAAYAAAAAVHWFLFVLTVILIGAYFHKIQFRIIRNYNIFTEHFYWVVCAARSVADAQKICREIDPKCVFSFSYVGPPQDSEVEDKKVHGVRLAWRRRQPSSHRSSKGNLLFNLPVSVGACFGHVKTIVSSSFFTSHRRRSDVLRYAY